AGAEDETRHVRDDERLVVVLDNPQVRHDGRERIVGDSRLGGGNPRDERALARIRQAHEANVGEQFELKLGYNSFAGSAALGKIRGLANRSREVKVALPA